MRLLAVVALVSLLVVCVTAERYVVVLQPGMLIPTRHTRASNIINLEIGLFVAFSADLTALELSLLSVDPIVNYIVPDADVFETACDGTQSSPLSWGQDRVDQRDATSGTYTHQTEGGAGVDVFVVDSGIDVTRPEFDGRADWPPPPYKGDFTGEGRFDGSSHGTHVAGTVGGDVYGVAKGVRIWATKVLDSEGRGSGTTLLEGLQEVHNFAKRSGRATVVNLSLGFGAVFQPADDAIAAMMEDNDRLVVVAAAGNSNVDACDASPGRATAAVTVAATNNADRRADFSNFGSCVDIFAPGVGIASVTSVNGPGGGAVQAFQGTSMAAPHVAGAAALFFWGFPEETGLEVIQRLKNSATTGRVTDLQGSPNVLLYTGDQCDATPADETVPPGGSGDPCSPNPCKNGGTCVTTALGTEYVCECPVGFSGRHCDPNPFAMGCSGLAPGTRCEDGDHCTTSDSCSDSGECEAGIYYCPLPGTTAPVSTTGPSNGLEAALEDHFLIIIIGVGSVLVIATAGTAVYLCTQRGGRSPARGERIAVSEKKMPKGKKAEIKSWEYETSSHGVDASGSYYHDETGSAAMTGGDDTSDAGSDSPDDDSMVDESARASSIRSESELLPGRSPSM